MKWVPDQTGRFPERPFYEDDELDRECEGIVSAFLKARHGAVSYPIETNDLVILLEQETADLDLFADLSHRGADVEGETAFSRRGKPIVRIVADLQDPRRENRLRTTLAHELGHVKLHNYLYGLHAGTPSPCCTQATMIGASSYDWLEWQAGYCCCAFLMPISTVRRTLREIRKDLGIVGTVSFDSNTGLEVVRRTGLAYRVSTEAARIRLLRLGYLTE